MTPLKTRLRPPRPFGHMLPRNRLLESMHAALDEGKGLFVVSGPAGAGKTTLLAQFAASLEQQGQSTNWLTMDEGDTLTERYAYVNALWEGTLPCSTLDRARMLEESSPETAARAVVTELASAIEALDHRVVLFMDEFYFGELPELIDGFRYLLRHRPPNLILVFGTRHLMPASLSKYEAQEALFAIDHAQLCFDLDETHGLLADFNVDLGREVAKELLGKTGGWPALVHLSTSLAGDREHPAEFVASLGGDVEQLGVFLQEEVLAGLAPEELAFLTRVSIARRLCAPLCAAITRNEDWSRAILENSDVRLQLELLDDDHHWFALNPMLRESLLKRLAVDSSVDIADLHRRASQWFQEEGLFGEALAHTLESGEHAAAIDLLEEHGISMLFQGNAEMLLEQLHRIPADKLDLNCDLLYQLGIISNRKCDLEATARIVEKLRSLDRNQSTNDPLLKPRLFILEAFALFIGQRYTPLGHRFAQSHGRAFSESADPSVKWPLSSLRGWLALQGDDLDGALEVFRVAQTVEAATNEVNLASVIPTGLMTANLELCRFDAARSSLESFSGQRLALLARNSPLARTWRGLEALLDYYSGNPQAAHPVLVEASGALPLLIESGVVAHFLRVLARSHACRGDNVAALALVDSLTELAEVRGWMELQAVAAHERVNQLLLLGEVSRAGEAHGNWKGRCERLATLVDDQNAAGHIEEWLLASRARLMLAAGEFGHAGKVLADLMRRFRGSGRRFRQLETLVLLAGCQAAAGEDSLADKTLGSAMRIDQEYRFVQVFREEAPRLAPVLRRRLAWLKRAPAGQNRRLQQEFICSILQTDAEKPAPSLPTVTAAAAPSTEGARLLEELTQREKEILAVLAEGCSNKEISQTLFISVATVKSHLKSAYSKLGVSRRTQALRLLIQSGFTGALNDDVPIDARVKLDNTRPRRMMVNER